jgi:hypothetical protein
MLAGTNSAHMMNRYSKDDAKMPSHLYADSTKNQVVTTNKNNDSELMPTPTQKFRGIIATPTPTIIPKLVSKISRYLLARSGGSRGGGAGGNVGGGEGETAVRSAIPDRIGRLGCF